MFPIPDIQDNNLICCTRSLPWNNIEIIKIFFFQSSFNLNVAKQFEKRWNFLNCLGAMEGKNIVTQKCCSGLRYLNNKNTHSIFSLAVAGRVSVRRNIRMSKSLKSFPEFQTIVGTFSCQLFFYDMSQLEISCMQPLCSIANQEKNKRLINIYCPPSGDMLQLENSECGNNAAMETK